jgi:hypothetical protein
MIRANVSPGFFVGYCQRLGISIFFYSFGAMGYLGIYGNTFMATQSGPGRPKMTDKEKRHARFLVKLNDAEYEIIRRAAGDKISTWARETLLRAAKRGARQN